MSTPLYVGSDVSLNTSVLGMMNQTGAHLAKAKTDRNHLPATQQWVND